MMYEYVKERDKLFTESGSEILIRVRDNVHKLLKIAGAFTLEKATSNVGGDTWIQMAAVDYLVEKGEIVETRNPTSSWGQYRIFTKRPE